MGSLKAGLKKINIYIEISEENAEYIINSLGGENLLKIKEVVIRSYEANISLITKQFLKAK